MRKSFRLLLGIASLALLMAMVAPVSEAQCPTGAREFGTIGGGRETAKLRIDPNGAHNQGLEIGRFWLSSDSKLGNNFDGNCPSQGNGQQGGGWWQLSQESKRGVRGFISGTGCSAKTCPEGPLTVVVEDWGAAGPPGTSDGAFFVVFTTDRTPGAIRDWDLAASRGRDGSVAMQEFPRPVMGRGQKVSFRAPATLAGTVVSYDLLRYVGSADPGRDRSLWQQVTSAQPGQGNFNHTASCDEGQNTFLAIGMTFAGGSGDNVPSALVGGAIEVACGGNAAPISRSGRR